MENQKKGQKKRLAKQIVLAVCIMAGAFSAQAMRKGIGDQICNDAGDYCCDDGLTGACCSTTPGHLCGG